MLKAFLHKIIHALSPEEVDSFLKEHHNKSKAQYVKMFNELRASEDFNATSIKNTDRALYYLEEVLLSHICHLKADHIDYYYAIGVVLREHHLLKESLNYMELALENYERHEYFSKCILVTEELLTYYFPIFDPSKVHETHQRRIQYRSFIKKNSQLIQEEQELQTIIDQISVQLIEGSEQQSNAYKELLQQLEAIPRNSFHTHYLYLVALHNIPDAHAKKPMSSEEAIDQLGVLFMSTKNHRDIYGMMLTKILRRQFYYKLLNKKEADLEEFMNMIHHIENKKIEIKHKKQSTLTTMQCFQLFYQKKNIKAAKELFFKKSHLDFLKAETKNYHPLMLPISILFINEDYKELVNFMRYYEEYLTQGDYIHNLTFKTILLVAYLEINHSKKQFYFDQNFKNCSKFNQPYFFNYMNVLETLHFNTKALEDADFKASELKKHHQKLKSVHDDALLLFWDQINVLELYLSSKLNNCSILHTFSSTILSYTKAD